VNERGEACFIGAKCDMSSGDVDQSVTARVIWERASKNRKCSAKILLHAMSALIRPINDSDDKLVRFMVAKANMESLAAANRRALYSPLYIAVWLALSAAFIEFMDWYPKPHYGFLGYLQPLPGFVSSNNSRTRAY
jgi:hypothetical protein